MINNLDLVFAFKIPILVFVLKGLLIWWRGRICLQVIRKGQLFPQAAGVEEHTAKICMDCQHMFLSCS